MPIQEFACAGCGATFELLVRGRPPRPECPRCGSRRTRKQISTFGVGAGGPGAETAPPPGG